MKRLAPITWFMLFGVILSLGLILSMNKTKGHACKWSTCPYKGVTADLAHRSVVAYTGEAYTDAYCLDILHLQYPTEDYDQLEERLFNNK